MQAGVTLARWFGREAKRVYRMLNESDKERDRRRLIEMVQRKGGSVTPRDLMRSSRQYHKAGDAEAALDDLVRAGHGHWVDVDTTEQGGRPTRRFKLAAPVDVDTTPANPERNRGSVNVNGDNR